MSDPRYAAGIIQGIKLHGGALGLFYLLKPSPWPELPDVGVRTCGPFSRCSGCKRVWTFVRFGSWPACLDCALRRANKAA